MLQKNVLSIRTQTHRLIKDNLITIFSLSKAQEREPPTRLQYESSCSRIMTRMLDQTKEVCETQMTPQSGSQ